MGRLINMMQGNLFGRKKFIGSSTEGTDVINGIDGNTCSVSSSTASCKLTSNSIEKNSTVTQSIICKDIDNINSNNEPCRSNNVLKLPDEKKTDNIKNILETFNIDNIEEKLYELERCYLFEQNNIIDKYELEKTENMAIHVEEKQSVKRAFEHEKDELLKEIERKDKMLYELTNIMKEEYTTKLEKQKLEYSNLLEEKERLFAGIIDEKLKRVVESLTLFYKNNNITDGLEDFQKLVSEYELFLSSLANKEKTLDDTAKEINGGSDGFLSLIHNEERLANDILIQKTKFSTNTFENTTAEFKVKKRTTSRTLSDNAIGLKACCKKHSMRDDESIQQIQHELAQAYRKQKTELLKLFNAEKEDYEKTLNKDKENFEKETRTEYVNRMAVERKAWQETIEDCEREVNILKYERQQMDKNYCTGVDMLKTEFEREKNIIHRKYSETYAQLKKDHELKLRYAMNNTQESNQGILKPLASA